MSQTTEAARSAGAKTPEDKKKPHHKKSERFVFEIDEGTKVSAVYVENIPYATIEAFNELGDSNKVQAAIIDAILSEEDAKTLRGEFTYGEVGDFFDQWNEESAIKLGE